MSGEAKRDPRRATFLKVHVRSDSGLADAVVCNVSTHGMMLRGEGLPRRGTFVEIVGGAVSVAGQVRWAIAGRCGVRTREAINLPALLGEPAAGDQHGAQPSQARYAAGARSRSAADGKAAARALDLALTVALLAGGVWLIGTAVTGLFTAPLHQVEAELAPARR